MYTWQRAVNNGNFVTWPGIESLSLAKHVPKSIDSAKGHLDQERKNLQSTKKPLQKIDDDDFFPSPDLPKEKTYSACATIGPFEAKHKAYHDLTGRFPHQSSGGNEYILIIYDYDSNIILHCALQNKTAGKIKRGWIELHGQLAKCGNQPKMYILDNKASHD
jgi:hypothetical protein